MKTRSLIATLTVILAAATSAAAQGPFSGSLFGERALVVARVVTTSAEEKALSELTGAADDGRIIAKTDGLVARRLSSITPADDVRIESTSVTTVTLTKSGAAGDAPNASSCPSSGPLRAAVSRPTVGGAAYAASVELTGPLGRFSATLTISEDETAIFPLPGNITAAEKAPAGAGRARRTYVVIQITPLAPPSPSVASAP